MAGVRTRTRAAARAAAQGGEQHAGPDRLDGIEEVPADILHGGYDLDMLGFVLDWLHERVSPYALAFMLACAMDVNSWTAYAFVAFFLTVAGIEGGRLAHALYHQGLLRWAWRHVHRYGKFVWRHLCAMRDVYLVKVVTCLLLLFIAASGWVWLRRVDILQLARDTLTFVLELPALLLNQHRLILAIHDWMHRAFLDHVVALMSAVWRWQRALIEWSPALGVACIAAELGAVTLLICVASAFSSSSYRQRLQAWCAAQWQAEWAEFDAWWAQQDTEKKVWLCVMGAALSTGLILLIWHALQHCVSNVV